MKKYIFLLLIGLFINQIGSAQFTVTVEIIEVTWGECNNEGGAEEFIWNFDASDSNSFPNVPANATGAFDDACTNGSSIAHSENANGASSTTNPDDFGSLPFTVFSGNYLATDCAPDIIIAWEAMEDDGAFSDCELNGGDDTYTGVRNVFVDYLAGSSGVAFTHSAVSTTGNSGGVACQLGFVFRTTYTGTIPGQNIVPDLVVENGCPNEPVNFDASGSTGTIASYEWDFGDGNTATTATATTTHTYTSGGGYVASVKPVDANGCATLDESGVVLISKAPDFTGTAASATTICIGDPVNLDGVVTSNEIDVPSVPINDPANIALPDIVGQEFVSTINVSGFPAGCTISDQSQVELCMDLSHDFKNDMTIELTAPNGATVFLYNRSSSNGGYDLGVPNGTQFVYCFSTSASGTLDDYTGGSPIPSGSYLPTINNSNTVGSFAPFIGSALNGTWTLTFTDNQGSDSGYLASWGLNILATTCSGGTTPTQSFTYPTQTWSGDGITGTTADPATAVVPTTVGTQTYTYTVTDDFGCEYTSTVDVIVSDSGICAPPPPCPELLTATATPDGCAGGTVTLTATVDTGTENEDYFIQWFEDGVAIVAANPLGADGLIGTADDASMLSYNHTSTNAAGSCGFTDHEYHAELYCINTQKLEQGIEDDGTNIIPCLVSTYSAAGVTAGNIDLTGLPSCAVLLGFDYGLTVASGGDFGESYICEALLEVSTPDGTEGPFCNGDIQAANGGTCPDPDIFSTCNGFPTAGAGTNTINNSFSYQYTPGVGTGTAAAFNFIMTVSDSYDDGDVDGEGCVNYVLLDVKYYVPPGCDASVGGGSANSAATSILVATSSSTLATAPNNGGTENPGGADAGALSGVRVCTAPVVTTDYTLPTGCENAVTDVCGDLSIGYSATAGAYDHTLTDGSSLVTPADGETVFYEIFVDVDGDDVSDCPACATVTGSYTLSYPDAPTLTNETICFGAAVPNLAVTAPPAGSTYNVYAADGLTQLIIGTTSPIDVSGLAMADLNNMAIGVYTLNITEVSADGCESPQSAVTIEVESCADISITDPCSCNDDQTLNTSGDGDGTFGEIVTIQGNTTSETWTVTVISFNTTGSDNTLPTGIAVTNVLAAAGGSNYSISFDHADGAGYTVEIEGPGAVGTAGNETLTISNVCVYPELASPFLADTEFCVSEAALALSAMGTDADGNMGALSYTIDNGATVATIDPAGLGAGSYTLNVTFDGNAINDDINAGPPNPAYPGCETTLDVPFIVHPLPDPSFTCPTMPVPQCDGNVALAPVDATGTWSGSGASFINLTTNDFEPVSAPIGIDLTITYTVINPVTGCSDSETCTFQVVNNCAANGGSFGN